MRIGLQTLCALVLLSSSAGLGAQPEPLADINQLKVAFIYNFTKYFTWPTSDTAEDFVLCLDASEAASGEFNTLAQRSTQNRPIMLRNTPATTADIAAQCHLWYVSAADFGDRRDSLDALSHSPVLVVSDAAGSRNAGAVIELAVVNRRVQFRINTQLITEKGLNASAFLLRLAQ